MMTIKQIFTSATLAASFAFIPIQPSSATNYGHGYGYGSSHYYGHGSNYGRHHNYNQQTNKRRHRSYDRHPNKSRHNTRSNYSGYSGKNCHSTHKYKYDSYGGKIRVNGTLCYDRYGNGYIVKGSRYIADHYR